MREVKWKNICQLKIGSNGFSFKMKDKEAFISSMHHSLKLGNHFLSWNTLFRLFRSILFSFQVFGDFLLLTSDGFCYDQKMYFAHFNFLYICWSLFYGLACSLSQYIFLGSLCILLFLGDLFHKYVTWTFFLEFPFDWSIMF